MKRKTVTIQQRPNGLYSWYGAPSCSCIMAVYKGEGIGISRLEHELKMLSLEGVITTKEVDKYLDSIQNIDELNGTLDDLKNIIKLAEVIKVNVLIKVYGGKEI